MTWGEQPVAASGSHPGRVLHHRCACSSCWDWDWHWDPNQIQNTLPALEPRTCAVRDLVCAASPYHTFCLLSTQQPSRRAQEDLLRSRFLARRASFHLINPSPSDIVALPQSLLAYYVVAHFILVAAARFHSFQQLLLPHALARSSYRK